MEKTTLALLRVGLKHGFKVYVSPETLKRINDGNLNSDWKAILEADSDSVILPDEFPHQDSPARFADVLWLKTGKVHAHFEVEERGDIPDSTFISGEEVRRLWPESERVLVVPREAIGAVNQVLGNRKSFWHVAPYHRILFTDEPKAHEPCQQTERCPASALPLELKIESKVDIVDSAGNNVAFRLKLRCPSDVLKRVRPGHFLQVQINSSARRYLSQYHSGSSYKTLEGSPNRYPEKLEFLGIPLSIYRIHYDNFEPSLLKKRSKNFLPPVFWELMESGEMKCLELLIRVVGNGTRTLHSLKEGDTVNALGPLGKAIDFPSDFESALLISGGVGLASLYPIARHLRERGYKVILFAGSHDQTTLQDKSGKVLPEFKDMGVECHATDEVHENKLVTELVTEWLSGGEYNQLSAKSRIFSCGPWLMLKQVHKIACQWDLPCTVVVDKLMLCGVGACMSCVVRTRKTGDSAVCGSDKPTEMMRSCVEGPAFESRNIVWD